MMAFRHSNVRRTSSLSAHHCRRAEKTASTQRKKPRGTAHRQLRRPLAACSGEGEARRKRRASASREPAPDATCAIGGPMPSSHAGDAKRHRPEEPAPSPRPPLAKLPAAELRFDRTRRAETRTGLRHRPDRRLRKSPHRLKPALHRLQRAAPAKVPPPGGRSRNIPADRRKAQRPQPPTPRRPPASRPIRTGCSRNILATRLPGSSTGAPLLPAIPPRADRRPRDDR
jgi:hypothetical protein